MVNHSKMHCMKLIPLVLLVLSFLVLRPDAATTAGATDNEDPPAVFVMEQQEDDPYAVESLLFFDEEVEFAGPLNYLDLLNH